MCHNLAYNSTFVHAASNMPLTHAQPFVTNVTPYRDAPPVPIGLDCDLFWTNVLSSTNGLIKYGTSDSLDKGVEAWGL